MSRPPRRRKLPRLLCHLAIVLGSGCLLGDEVSYSPQEDDAAIVAIASTWVGASFSLSLCEDLDAPEPDNTCQVDHAVRGGGRGRRHVETHGGVGCGGCPYEAVAFVRGAASGTGLPGTVAVEGEITLGRTPDDEPYAFPYLVQLRCVTPGQTCALSGTLSEDGTLELTVDVDLSSASVTLPRTGPTTACQ